MSRIIVCDVNETLLDVEALRPRFLEALGDAGLVREWFATVLLYSEVVTIAGPYVDFAGLGAAALDMTAAGRQITLAPEARRSILQGMLALPAHAEVREGLETMRDAGLRLVTLTNSPPASVQQQLTNAGLAPLFERSFSVDAVRRFKPAAEVYRSVAEALAVPLERLRLVAAHAWDVHGALQAGCAAAFVARPGKVLFPLGPQPDITGPDFLTVARKIVAAETGSSSGALESPGSGRR